MIHLQSPDWGTGNEEGGRDYGFGGDLQHVRSRIARRNATHDSRPVSGLTRGVSTPGRIAFPRLAQWLIDPPQHVYRCGGSAGIVGQMLVCPTHRLPVSSRE